MSYLAIASAIFIATCCNIFLKQTEDYNKIYYYFDAWIDSLALGIMFAALKIGSNYLIQSETTNKFVEKIRQVKTFLETPKEKSAAKHHATRWLLNLLSIFMFYIGNNLCALPLGNPEILYVHRYANFVFMFLPIAVFGFCFHLSAIKTSLVFVAANKVK